jgi:hypothetical protein
MHGQKKTKLILIQCARCRKWQVVRVDPEDLERHANGMFVQFAFTGRDGTPYLSPAGRELFISACCESCWHLLVLTRLLTPVHNLKPQTSAAPKFLVRTLNNEVRGFLSDSYRRLDSRPIIEAFVTGVQRLGALPYKGIVTDTKVAIQAILPDVFDVIPGEVIAFVLSLENSDFGNGALSLRVGALRIWCDNLAVFEENMRQIHLGRRLDENIVFSQRTYLLDTKTTVSALEDIIGVQLNREGLKRRMELLAVTAQKAVDPQAAMKMLKHSLGVGQAQQVIDAYKSADIEMLPAGNDAWRLSNAISWIAGKETDGEKKLDLMKLAGKVLLPGKGDIPFIEAEVVEQAA